VTTQFSTNSQLRSKGWNDVGLNKHPAEAQVHCYTLEGWLSGYLASNVEADCQALVLALFFHRTLSEA
jgi:hypothetical protein